MQRELAAVGCATLRPLQTSLQERRVRATDSFSFAGSLWIDRLTVDSNNRASRKENRNQMLCFEIVQGYL